MKFFIVFTLVVFCQCSTFPEEVMILPTHPVDVKLDSNLVKFEWEIFPADSNDVRFVLSADPSFYEIILDTLLTSNTISLELDFYEDYYWSVKRNELESSSFFEITTPYPFFEKLYQVSIHHYGGNQLYPETWVDTTFIDNINVIYSKEGVFVEDETSTFAGNYNRKYIISNDLISFICSDNNSLVYIHLDQDSITLNKTNQLNRWETYYTRTTFGL